MILNKHAKSHAASMAVAQVFLFSGISRWWTLFPLSFRNRMQCQRHVNFIDLAWILVFHILENRTMNLLMLNVIQHNNITFQTVEWITKMSIQLSQCIRYCFIYFPCIPHLILKEMRWVLYLHLKYTNKTQEREVDELVWFRKLLVNRRLSRLKKVSYSFRAP